MASEVGALAIDRPGPLISQDNRDILENLLGLPPDEVAQLSEVLL